MKRKFRTTAMLFAIGLLIAIPTYASVPFLGSKKDPSKDKWCCKDGQNYIYHYSAYYVFWIQISSSYSPEPIGEPGTCINSGGCPGDAPGPE